MTELAYLACGTSSDQQLANPRYTGRQVWNRQRTDHDSAAGRKGDGAQPDQ